MLKKLVDRIGRWLDDALERLADYVRPKTPVPVRVRVRRS